MVLVGFLDHLHREYASHAIQNTVRKVRVNCNLRKSQFLYLLQKLSQQIFRVFLPHLTYPKHI